MYSDCGIAFAGAGSWSFGDYFARNVIIFGIDNSSSIHVHNRKNGFLVLGEGPADDINDSVGSANKNLI